MLGVNKTSQLQRVTLAPTIYVSNFSEDTPALNVSETPVISKSAYLSCIPNTTKSQNLNKYKKEQTITETKNMRVRNNRFKIICCGLNLHGEKKIK